MIEIRTDSLFQFASPLYDEEQEEYVWGISDPPNALLRDEDLYYTVREGDRLDLISYRYYREPRWFWVIANYNNIKNPMNLVSCIGKEIRLPSKAVLEKVYKSATNPS